MPVWVLITTWALGVAAPNFKVLGNVSFIVIGVIIASFGEIKFDVTGFTWQVGGLAFEATRLVMVQRLLSSAEYKMDPLVSLYYFAPVCAVMNAVPALLFEVPTMTMQNIYDVGAPVLVLNAGVAFLLNVSVVFLVRRPKENQQSTCANMLQVGKTSGLALTLCGVLKDILLVCASMMIWGTQVTATQFFGYGIALAGLLYYRLGAEQIKQHFATLGRSWAEFGVNRPALRKTLVFGLVLVTMFILLGGLAPRYAPEQTAKLQTILGQKVYVPGS